MMTLIEVAKEITSRLEKIFLKDEKGYRPVYGWYKDFQEDENWEYNILFYEYFHGDNGAGIGASHQTGWTGMIAYLMVMFRTSDFQKLMEMSHYHKGIFTDSCDVGSARSDTPLNAIFASTGIRELFTCGYEVRS